MDNRIKIISVYENTTKDGKTIFNGNIEFKIDEIYSIWFKLTKLPKNDGNGHYFQWPQTIYNAEKAKETNYKEGVNKWIFGNKAFGVAVQEAMDEYINTELKGNQQFTQAPAFPTEAEKVNAEEVNLDEIKF